MTYQSPSTDDYPTMAKVHEALASGIQRRRDRYIEELHLYTNDLKAGLEKLATDSQYTILARYLLGKLGDSEFFYILPLGILSFLARLESDGKKDFVRAKSHYESYQDEYKKFEGLLQVII